VHKIIVYLCIIITQHKATVYGENVKMGSITDTLSAFYDDNSLVLFNTIALASGDGTILISMLNPLPQPYVKS